MSRVLVSQRNTANLGEMSMCKHIKRLRFISRMHTGRCTDKHMIMHMHRKSLSLCRDTHKSTSTPTKKHTHPHPLHLQMTFCLIIIFAAQMVFSWILPLDTRIHFLCVISVRNENICIDVPEHNRTNKKKQTKHTHTQKKTGEDKHSKFS